MVEVREREKRNREVRARDNNRLPFVLHDNETIFNEENLNLAL